MGFFFRRCQYRLDQNLLVERWTDARLSRQFRRSLTVLLLCGVTMLMGAARSRAEDPLPSWNAGQAKDAIVTFVERVTKQDGPDFVPVEERIAVFDNDGTLWSEQPYYVQLQFAIERIRAMSPQHPEWKQQQPFQTIFDLRLSTLEKLDKQSFLQLIMASHTGMTTTEFAEIVRDWIATAKHPRFDRPYTDLAFQPMLELLAYLRANGFKTYIVSGGGVDFMRPWAEKVYGVPPEQVIGSCVKVKFEMRDGEPVLIRLPELDFVDDKEGKPVGIERFIGRRPLAAFGNSDGDRQMLAWTAAGKGARLALLVHHTDDKREWAYDRESFIGRLDQALDEGQKQGWTIVDMKNDWRVIYPFELEQAEK